MERRCRAAAAGRSARVADVSEWVGVGFRMSRVLLVSSRDQVREVFNYPDAITRIPGARRWLRGLANVRGTLLPIIDLQQFLGGDETVNGRSTRIMVACISAMHDSGLAAAIATTSAVATPTVRPIRTTRPRATNRSPMAGASRLILNSTLSTADPSGIRVRHA